MRKMQKIAMLLVVIILTTIIASTHSFAISTTVYDVDNMLSPSNVSVEELEYALKGDLKPLASAYISAEEETGVNAIFIAAISALESGWGKSYMATHKNNLFGYGNKTFSSQEESIQHVAKALKNNYLTSTGPYYHGTTVKAVEKCYCPSPVGEWSKLVSQIMKGLNSDIQKYRTDHPQKSNETAKKNELIVDEKNVSITEEEIESIKVQQKKYNSEIIKKEIQIVLNQNESHINNINDINEFREELLKISKMIRMLINQ